MDALFRRERGSADALKAARLKTAQLVLKYQALQDKVVRLQQKLELAQDRTALLTKVIQGLDTMAARPDAAAAERSARTLFELAESFMLRGELDMATACLRACGPALADQVRRCASPDGHIIGPDFLIIGSPRAASTWIRRLIAFHPRVFVLAQEQHYFAQPETPLSSYIGKFASQENLLLDKDPRTASPEGRLFGEKSPRYVTMPEANIAFLAALFPKVRLICTVREPVARAWSEIKLRRLEQEASDPDILGGRRRCEELDAVIRNGCYLEHLPRWAKHFPPEQILLLDFAQIRDDPAAAAAAAFEHIGVAPFEIERRHLFLPAGARPPSPPSAELADFLGEAYSGQPWDVGSLRNAIEKAGARVQPA